MQKRPSEIKHIDYSIAYADPMAGKAYDSPNKIPLFNIDLGTGDDDNFPKTAYDYIPRCSMEDLPHWSFCKSSQRDSTIPRTISYSIR